MALPSLLLKLPAFSLAVFFMYWSLPLSNLFLFIKSWKLLGGRNDVYRWCQFLVHIMCIRVRKYGSTDLYRGGPCMYLSNHRSWADFFIDAYLTHGYGQLMSRMAVMYAFPMFMIPVSLVRGCICFKRGSIADKQAFNAWIDRCVAASPCPGICLFPEGHRSRLPRSLSLKRGMLHYAYSRRMTVQIVMSAHKEGALDEKSCHVRFGSTIVTGYGTPIATDAFDTFEDFFTALQAAWDDMWVQVFSADPAELPPLDLGTPTGFPYPLVLKASQLFWTLLELALMSWGVVKGWLLWMAAATRVGGILGLAGLQLQALQALPLLWLLVSVVSCVDTTLPQPLLAPDGSVLQPANGSSQRCAAAAEGERPKAA